MYKRSVADNQGLVKIVSNRFASPNVLIEFSAVDLPDW